MRMREVVSKCNTGWLTICWVDCRIVFSTCRVTLPCWEVKSVMTVKYNVLDPSLDTANVECLCYLCLIQSFQDDHLHPPGPSHQDPSRSTGWSDGHRGSVFHRWRDHGLGCRKHFFRLGHAGRIVARRTPAGLGCGEEVRYKLCTEPSGRKLKKHTYCIISTSVI